MQKAQPNWIQRQKRLFIFLLAIPTLLLIPLLAMLLTNEVNWTLSDFVIGGILLLGAGLSIEFVLRKVKKTQVKIALVGAFLVVFVLVWAELAVGIFGTPFAGN